MLSWRARRQLIVVIILGAAAGGAAFMFAGRLLPEPACTDNRKNQGELEVDCGGPCAPCELKNPRPLSIFWAKAVPVRAGVYDAVAQVENLNQSLSSKSFSYEFLLFDDLGLIAARRGETFIFPRERIHVVGTNLETSRFPSRVEFRVREVVWSFEEDLAPPALAVERRVYKVMEDNGREQGVVEAEILNRTPFDFREVEVGIIVLDSSGNLLGANSIIVDRFISGSRRTLKSFWPEPLPGEAAKIEIEPRVNLFDPTAILKPQ